MGGISALFQSVLMLGVVLTGLLYIVHPPTGKEIAMRTGTVALAVFAIDQALSYLWSSGIGKLLLMGVIGFIAAKLLRAGNQ